ncbi:MAG TPA: hypothetical protein VER96_29045 [Polyangiaceae bacterium]|nr:hypothetical protein [Polyangiaceae bacterium]
MRPLTVDLNDPNGRPYFLWDEDVSVGELRRALADTLRIFVDDAEWSQRYERGVPIDSLKIVGQTKDRGTELSLCLDPTILPSTEFDADEFTEWARGNVKSLSVTISDRRTGTTSRFQPSPEG